MRITFHMLKEMDRVCREQGCRLFVVIIPTKETVFSDYIEHNPALHLSEALNKVIVNERSARKALVEFLDTAGIAYLDMIPALKDAVENQLYAQTTRDMHPGKNGYRVIGETVAEYLRRSEKVLQVEGPLHQQK
jgi:lysophospholipase L1-like esterase